MKNLDNYVAEVLSGWEEAYKKGQLTLLILLSLKENPKHMAEIKEFISDVTSGSLVADDKSLYRALRRHAEIEMIDYTQVASDSGPDRKIYELTDIGSTVLDRFISRNITTLYGQDRMQKLIGKDVK